MEVVALQHRRSAADIAPEQLAGNASLTQEQKIAEGARQFEALLLRQILQETQKTTIQSKFTDTSTAASIYRDLVTQQLADSISKSGSLGLARSFEQQLTGHPAKAGRTSPAGQDRAPTPPPTSRAGPVAARPHLPDAPASRDGAASKCIPAFVPPGGMATVPRP